MRTLLVLGLAAAVTGCNNDPPAPIDSPARTTVVAVYEDCTLYRTVTSRGPDITWVRCSDTVQAANPRSCGKGCTRYDPVITHGETK